MRKDLLMDLAELSYKQWEDITSFLTKTPQARKFLKMASKEKPPDEYFDKMIEPLENERDL